VAAAVWGLDRERATTGLGLVAIATATSVLLAISRSGWGVEAAATSRYSTLTGIGVIGAYRLALALRRGQWRNVMLATLGAMMLVGYVMTLRDGYQDGAKTRESRLLAAVNMMRYRDLSDAEFCRYYFLPTTRQSVAILDHLQLSVFRGGLSGASP
jgi:hypothetical protein